MEIVKGAVTYTKYSPVTHQPEVGPDGKPAKVKVEDVRKLGLTATDITFNPSFLRIVAEEGWNPVNMLAGFRDGWIVAQNVKKRDELEVASGKIKGQRVAQGPTIDANMIAAMAALAAAQPDNPQVAAILAALASKGVTLPTVTEEEEQ